MYYNIFKYSNKLKCGMVWSRYTTILGTECGGTSQRESSIPELGGFDGFDIFLLFELCLPSFL
jgi:hypothetical protein